jgi:DNA repair ATPase RecN
MSNRPSLIIQRLVLSGVSKNYEATFEPGLNIVRGAMDSGKSTILHMINYCLGGSNRKILYDEVRAKVRLVFLQLSLNGQIFTLERQLLDSKAAVKVYACPYDNREEVFPQFMSPEPQGSMPDGWLSDFILESLGIARVKIRESSKNPNADEDRLSFRDLMKLMFLKQTEVGSDGLLDYKNKPVFFKNVNIQKFVFNVHDEQLSNLKSQRNVESAALNDLQKSEKIISAFLNDVKIPLNRFTAGDQIDEAKNKIQELDKATQDLKSNLSLSTQASLALRQTITNLKSELDAKTLAIGLAKKQIDNFTKLKSTYRLEYDNLQYSKLARPHLASLQTDKTISCPLCTSALSFDTEAIPETDIAALERSLKNRLAGLDTSVKNSLEKIETLKTGIAELEKLINDNTQMFDQSNLSSISPLIAMIEASEKTKIQAHLELSQIKRNLSIYNKFTEIKDKIRSKQSVIDNLNDAIATVEGGLVDLDNVITELGATFSNYMNNSAVQNVQSANYNKTFTANLRGISYYDHLSGGIKTVTSIGMYLTRFLYTLDHKSNLPPLLMIDTPGQNIGRKRSADDDASVSDPDVYEKIYQQLLDAIDHAEKKEIPCQIIVVDNDFPDILTTPRYNEKFHLVKRFQKNSDIFDKGLIDDA